MWYKEILFCVGCLKKNLRMPLHLQLHEYLPLCSTQVPYRAEEITIPADVTPERVPTHIVDYSGTLSLCLTLQFKFKGRIFLLLNCSTLVVLLQRQSKQMSSCFRRSPRSVSALCIYVNLQRTAEYG